MTVRDWSELLIVPVALVVIGFVFSMQQDVRQQALEARQRALEARQRKSPADPVRRSAGPSTMNEHRQDI